MSFLEMKRRLRCDACHMAAPERHHRASEAFWCRDRGAGGANLLIPGVTDIESLNGGWVAKIPNKNKKTDVNRTTMIMMNAHRHFDAFLFKLITTANTPEEMQR